MPKWENCIKIHEGCGGIVRWVEAVHTPGVGYYGDCLHCLADEIVVENIIPIKNSKVEIGVFLENQDYKALEDLRWNNDSNWEENQERLLSELQDQLGDLR